VKRASDCTLRSSDEISAGGSRCPKACPGCGSRQPRPSSRRVGSFAASRPRAVPRAREVRGGAGAEDRRRTPRRARVSGRALARSPRGLLVEVRPPEPPRLRGGEPGCAERLDDLVREVPLIGGKARRCVPGQSRTDVLVCSEDLRAVELVRTPM